MATRDEIAKDICDRVFEIIEEYQRERENRMYEFLDSESDYEEVELKEKIQKGIGSAVKDLIDRGDIISDD